MNEFSSEAMKAGMPGTEKEVSEMTAEELKAFRTSFDPDEMGFDGIEGIDEEEEMENGSNETGN